MTLFQRFVRRGEVALPSRLERGSLSGNRDTSHEREFIKDEYIQSFGELIRHCTFIGTQLITICQGEIMNQDHSRE